MSVDYTGHFGIGYEIIESDKISDEDIEEGLSEYLHEIDIDKRFSFFQVGSGSYTGEENKHYLIVKNPFSCGLDLSRMKIILDNEIGRLRLESIGEFKVVGGLEMW